MVIVHIANIDSSVIGGVQVAVPQMIKAQLKHGTVGFVNTHGDSIVGFEMLSYDKQFDLTKFPSPFSKPDLIVFHELYRFEYIGIYKELKRKQIPYVIIPHGCLSVEAQKRKYLKKAVANIMFFNAFLKSARYIQYLSDNEANMSAFMEYPSFICGIGISIPEKKKKGFFGNGIKMVYIGRLEIHTKGLDLLVGAIKECESLLRSTSAKMEIYGPNYNGEIDILHNMVEKFEITDLVILGGEKTGEEKEHILLAADCFIQSSRTEGLPMGPLEALGYGLPCIVTDGVGLGGLIQSFGAGYRCETSINGLADAIKRFIAERENIKSMSRAAIKLVENKFDRNLIAKQTVEIYSRIVKSK